MQVRSERNKAREEVRILRGRLEVSQRETGVLRREKNDLEAQMALITQTHMMRSRNKDDLVEKPTDLRDQVDTEDIVSIMGFGKKFVFLVLHCFNPVFLSFLPLVICKDCLALNGRLFSHISFFFFSWSLPPSPGCFNIVENIWLHVIDISPFHLAH